MQDINVTASVSGLRQTTAPGGGTLSIPVGLIATVLARLGLLRKALDSHLIRAAMVLIFLMFGYQKWFEYEAQALIPYISNGPLISWLYTAFGVRGATWFLGASEWLICGLLLVGFWNERLGIFGAAGSRSWPLSPLSPSCQTGGPRRPADSPR